ncbi:MAG: hypothetical protein MZV70_06945 [Desulfobacterales bacterium]|nr:hypothetical protein [Desulfobacterales bacterium]
MGQVEALAVVFERRRPPGCSARSGGSRRSRSRSAPSRRCGRKACGPGRGPGRWPRSGPR